MTVYLVGAGPGDADLLTVRAARLLRQADAVVHDRLITKEILDLVAPDAELFDVGKRPGFSDTQERINDLLVTLGRRHGCVVRLKGGDPFVFGRGGEEAQILAQRGIDVEVVAGITSAFAGPLLAGIPVTHRGLSHGVTVVTGSAVPGATVDFRRLANPDLTLVVLMGIRRRRTIARELIEGGLYPTTPVAVVERASTDQQRVLRCDLAELGELNVSSPAVLVIGAVAVLDLGRVGALAASYALSS